MQDLRTFCNEINKHDLAYNSLRLKKIDKELEGVLQYLYTKKKSLKFRQTLESKLYKNYYEDNMTFKEFLLKIYVSFSKTDDIADGKKHFNKYLNNICKSISKDVKLPHSLEDIRIFLLKMLRNKYRGFLVETYIKQLLLEHNIEVVNADEETDTDYKIDLIIKTTQGKKIGLQIKADTFYGRGMNRDKRRYQTSKQCKALQDKVVEDVYYIFYNIDSLNFKKHYRAEEDLEPYEFVFKEVIYSYIFVIGNIEANTVATTEEVLESLLNLARGEFRDDNIFNIPPPVEEE